MKVVIYARISTKQQNLEQQIEACKKFCAYKEFEVAHVYQDTGSGKDTKKRPQYLEMQKGLRQLQYDGVVVFRLDRLGRNLRDLVLFVEEMKNKGIEIFSINESFDSSTAIGRAMMNIILVLAEFEREQISEATSQRLAAIKASGKKLGRPNISSYQTIKVINLYKKYRSINRVQKECRLSYGSCHKIITEWKQEKGLS